MFDVPNSSIIQDELSFIYLAVIKMSLWTFLDNFFFLSPWSFIFQSGEFPLSELWSTLSPFSASFPLSLFWHRGTEVGHVTDDYPVSLHGFTRYINSSVMALYFFFSFVLFPHNS